MTRQAEADVRVVDGDVRLMLALSQGDAGAFDAAGRFYQQAIQIDPSFRIAGDKADEALGQAVVSGDVSTALTAAYEQDPDPVVDPVIDPLGSRLLQLNTSIGLPLVPGIDSREPAVEGGVPGSLPDPPPPPSGNKK